MDMFSRFSTMFNARFPRQGGPGPPGPGPGQRGEGSGDGQLPDRGFRQRTSSTSSNSAPSTSNKKARQDEGEEVVMKEDVQACQVDNSNAVIAKIALLYAERLMSDITIVINGAEYPAHRLILCASSDVFQVMLMNGVWNESKESRIVLQESAECRDVFEDFLKYLYTGKIKLQLASVLHLLILADKYNVKDLVSLCLVYMQTHIPAAAHYNQLILWYQYTSNFGQQHRTIAECCRSYLKWNMETVCKCDDFPQLEMELFISILQDDDLVVKDENQLYQIVEYWLLCRMERRFVGEEGNEEFESDFLQMVYRTMQHIRFPMMTPRQIADLVQSPLVRNCKLLMERMALAMSFHNGRYEECYMDVDSGTSIDRRRYLSSPRNPNYQIFNPRLYCTDNYSILMRVPFTRTQHYESHKEIFTTPQSFAEYVSGNGENQIEWSVDCFPKAVQFQRFGMIGWQSTTELPEHILKTVRLSISCQKEDPDDIRVRIGVLLLGSQDGVEHTRKVITRNYIFCERERVMHIDHLVPYGDLNPCAECVVRRPLEELPRFPEFSQNARWPQPPPRQSFPDSSASPQIDNNHMFLNSQREEDPNNASCYSCRGALTKSSCFLFDEGTEKTLKIRVVITPLP